MSDPKHLAGAVKSIALVGASNKPERPSYGVMQFLLSRGYTVYPINPGLTGQTLHGQPVYPALGDCPAPVDMVDIFRNTEDAAKVINEAIMYKNQLDIKVIWCQLGVVPLEAAQQAEEAGLTVILDRCPAIEWR